MSPYPVVKWVLLGFLSCSSACSHTADEASSPSTPDMRSGPTAPRPDAGGQATPTPVARPGPGVDAAPAAQTDAGLDRPRSPDSQIPAAEKTRQIEVTAIDGPSMWNGCVVSARGDAAAELVCPESSAGFVFRGACVELSTMDITPAPGKERVLACGTYMYGGCPSTSAPVVVVEAGGELITALGTSNDMSCGSRVRIVKRGRLAELLLEGGGEDGTYHARYGWNPRAAKIVRVGFRFDAAIY